ncbi:hypothetical protein OFO03_06290 [Campylobacter sp. JMF_02 ED1]|uniref:hypothetical protein n=1 Tax=unclassified Campylobacter TaxID=2593542 RepID=UPI0022E9B758|nr:MULTISPECIES: hypothetical protein [unclassified Campylobacter]MDA3049070.1 hypothetical protein [Campylobacter sp. JMF_15 NE4]MDA3051505.1 hypothetical protein [Campylobacter sp. JMF_02 ED1]
MFFSCSDIIENTIFTREIVKKYIIQSNIFDMSKIELITDCIIKGEANFDENLLLSIEEKRNLGLNTRLKISKGLVDFFEFDKLKGLNPKDEVNKLCLRLFHYFSLIRKIKKFKEMNIKKIEFFCVDDERTCEFCKSNNGKKFDINDDLADFVDDHCTCYKNMRVGGEFVFNYEL